MRSVGLKVLKNKLSEYVRLAASGETVLVTDRDRVVAQITPPQKARGPSGKSAVWERLVREGVITPAKRVPSKPAPTLPVKVSFEELMKGVDEDREDR